MPAPGTPGGDARAGDAAEAGSGAAAQTGAAASGAAATGVPASGAAASGAPAPGGPESGTSPVPGTGPAPESDELHILHRVLRMAPRHAVLALTDGSDAERAAEAVRVGAQDYLFRDELDGRLLMRAVRYAVERKRADLAQRQLTESRLRAQENARLERGLLPPGRCWRAATCGSPPGTGPAAPVRCWAATSTTPSAPRTASSTR